MALSRKVSMTGKKVRIGGASGFWGDAPMATPQLLSDGRLDYIVYDYLAEITMSILARARAKDPRLGYASDFLTAAMQPNLQEIARQRVKVISNAGGVNPGACAEALRELLRAANLDLKVAVVRGDDLTDRRESLAERGVVEMFSGTAFPPAERIASINAYLGAFPIAEALDRGADIVITGRCVDSAVTLGACIHEFGWGRRDYDRLAGGSLAGHLIECGTQATGGNFTDWEQVVDSLPDAGYPIVEVEPDGSFVCTKPAGTGGLVSVGTVAEQMLYEIGDPAAYVLPDVVCDFTGVGIAQLAVDRVRVSGARGRAAPTSYKVSATYADGFRGGEVWTVYGRDAERKARKIAENAFIRARRMLKSRGLPDFTDTCVEIIGAESHYGAARRAQDVREVDLKAAARHPSAAGIEILFKEFIGTALAAPPGLTGFAGRPRPSPVVRLFSFLLPKQAVEITVDLDGQPHTVTDPSPAGEPTVGAQQLEADAAWPRPPEPPAPEVSGETVRVPLERLAWCRSGDKGNGANIGVIARRPEYLPYLWASLTTGRVAERFAHFLEGRVERFLLPGLPAINFVLHDVLGGGGIASLRNDPQGKGYGQLLLDEPVEIPMRLLEP
ncbi:MAG TPA: acyclic terpene utilization AtuA family protein [Steroidobacteraceae bacterium]|nr:acyclic terpene utilization AtuA family protein [Steroidobacteraceae bacterium]